MKKYILFVAIMGMAHLAVAQDLADLFESNKYSVVTIYTEEVENAGTGDPRTFTSNEGLGSGVLIRDNMVLTASHVVASADEIIVEFFDGEKILARTFRVSKLADVAVIKLETAPSNAKIAVIGNSDETRIGEDIFVIGAPMGLPYSLSRGVISGRESENKITGEGKILEFFQTDAAINTGNSGGPMFNYKGEVIGIVSSILTRSGGFEGIGFAATSQVARELLNSRSSKYFGTEIVPLSYELAKILNVPQESGWLIQHVVKESPAGQLGLKGGFRKVTIDEEEILLGGDIILQVDHIKITDADSYFKVAEHLDRDESTVSHKIMILRGGDILEFNWVSTGF
ncbi:MAG: trypsin-like peptidase domain-containing protein [Bacteroides sp.]|nr:trypsin-like peptidase domain-containing protein [Bacteroides sp.]